jgi:hypothetical protein
MLKKIYKLAALAALSPLMLAAQPSTRDFAVEITAQVISSPSAIRLAWRNDTLATSWTVYRKTKNAHQWGTALATLTTDTSYIDSQVSPGSAFEYKVEKTVKGDFYKGVGYIYAGIEVPMPDYRGKMLLIYPKTLLDSLSPEIARLTLDLIGDGWQVVPLGVPLTLTPDALRKLIASYYKKDPKNTKSVFLLGHLPVLYSGDDAIDGHVEHTGAWPADMIYGDVDGDYTDNLVHDPNAQRTENQNIEGDGKLDQTILTSPMELQVGRVDMYNLPAFGKSEIGLLKQYLDKDHQWRIGGISIPERGLVRDNFGVMAGEVFATSGYRSFAPMFGSSNVVTTDYYKTLKSNGYLWSYGAGPGTFNNASGVINSILFAQDSIQTVFTMLFGSWFGDWDSQDNLLRAALANKGPILTNAWSGRPVWQFHHMALGETVGYSAWVSQNNYTSYFKSTFLDTNSRVVNAALMGDPSLRMQVVKPASSVVSARSGNGIQLAWQASLTNNVLGYNIYRASSYDSMFIKLNTSPVNAQFFTDPAPLNGKNVYMVRAVYLQTTPSGTYYNMSSGTFDTLSFNSAISMKPAPMPLNIYPNPASQQAYIQMPADMLKGELKVMDMLGRIILADHISTTRPGSIYTMNTSSFKKGIYLVEILSGGHTYRSRLAVQ